MKAQHPEQVAFEAERKDETRVGIQLNQFPRGRVCVCHHRCYGRFLGELVHQRTRFSSLLSSPAFSLCSHGLWVLDENCCCVWGVPSCGTGHGTEMMLVWQSNAMWILHHTAVEFCILPFEDLYQQYISLFRSLFDLRLQCLEVIPLTLALMKGKKNRQESRFRLPIPN